MLEAIIAALIPLVVEAGLRVVRDEEASAFEDATKQTSALFQIFPDVDAQLRGWWKSDEFVAVWEQIEAGDREASAAIVASFEAASDFHVPSDWRGPGPPDVVGTFLQNLVRALSKTRFGAWLHEQREEVRHKQGQQLVTLYGESHLQELRQLRATVDEIKEGVGVPSSIDREIDEARDLINSGRITEAQQRLAVIRDGKQWRNLTTQQRFRVCTNLGVCAIAAGDEQAGCSLFEQANRWLPDSSTGLSNLSSCVLERDPQEAKKLAARARAADSPPTQATANYILACEKLGEDDEIEQLIEKEQWVLNEAPCLFALAQWCEQRQQYARGIEYCQRIPDADAIPESLVLLAQLALLDAQRIVESAGSPTAEWRSQLVQARDAATRAIALVGAHEFPFALHDALVIRSRAYLMLGDVELASADVTRVLADDEDNQPALVSKGLVLHLQGEARAALEALRRAPDVFDEHANSALIAELLIESNRAMDAVSLLDGAFEKFQEAPTKRRAFEAATLGRAYIASGMLLALEAKLTVFEEGQSDPLPAWLLGICAKARGDIPGAVELLESAQRESSDPHIVAWVASDLAPLIRDLQRFREAARQYEIVVDGPQHPWAPSLLVCHVNAQELKPALELARAMIEADESRALALDVEARVLARIGDFDGAVASQRRLIATTSTAAAEVELAVLLVRIGDLEGARRAVSTMRKDQLSEDPKAMMKLASVQAALGDRDAIETAYQAQRLGLTDPDFLRAFLSLSLASDGSDPDVVGPGCAVTLDLDGTESTYVVLEQGEEPRTGSDLPLDDDLTQSLLGRTTGSSGLVAGFSTFTVKRLESKIKHAVGNTIRELQTRFSDSGIRMLRVAPEDPREFFFFIDQRSQAVKRAEELYRSGAIPMSSLCASLGISPAEVWRDIAEAPWGFMIANGAGNDRALPRFGAAPAITLDLTALMAIHRLGIGEQVRESFPEVFIPWQAIESIQELSLEPKLVGTPVATVGSSGGDRRWMIDIDPEQQRSWYNSLKELLTLAKSFTPVGCDSMLDIPSDRLIDGESSIGREALASVLVAAERGTVLLADDGKLRERAAASYTMRTAWTHDLIRSLAERGVLSEAEFAEAEATLLDIGYVWWDRERLLQMLRTDRFSLTATTRKLLRHLEGDIAPVGLATSVLAYVLVNAFNDRIITPAHAQLVGVAVDTLSRQRHLYQAAQQLIAEVDRVSGVATSDRQRIKELIRDDPTVVQSGGLR